MNRNRLCFGLFRFKPKFFFVCFEDTLCSGTVGFVKAFYSKAVASGYFAYLLTSFYKHFKNLVLSNVR
jgi:hypothetical protein